MTIDAVLFDADGVVQGTPPGWLDRLERRLAIPGLLPELLDAERSTLTGRADFPAAVAVVLARCGRAERLDEVLACWHEIDTYADVLSIVDAIRAAGVRCYLATNQQRLRSAYMRRELGYDRRFDGQFYSCELGVAKPDVRYFNVILRQLQLSSTQVLFIDDKQANVDAAAGAGLHARLYAHSSGDLERLLGSFGLGACSSAQEGRGLGLSGGGGGSC